MNDELAEFREILRLAAGHLERLAGDGVVRIPVGERHLKSQIPNPKSQKGGWVEESQIPPLRQGCGGQANPGSQREEGGKTAEAPLSLSDLAEAVARCRKCGLAATRRKTVFGTGSARAALFLVGEAPGAEEDRQGLPFVGRAGRLLTRMLAAIGLSREEVYITNVLKCRPPGNRDPRPDEVGCCEPYLLGQLEQIKPRLICALGRHAAQTLLRTETGINKLRGRFHDYHGIAILPTYHPAYLLRSPEDKRKAWDDLKKVRAFLDGAAARHGKSTFRADVRR